ncbi:MAG: D-Ala-D-Ala carboxypeptidase family metallohydrolase, partial [Akkermansiaceae bacterium]
SLTLPMSQSHSPVPSPSIITPDSSALINRRGIISTLGLATTALFAGSMNASAGWFGSDDNDIPVVKVKTTGSTTSKPSQQVGGFDQEWVRLEGRNLTNYVNYIRSLKLKNISAQDVILAHAKERGGVWNRLPPRQYWTRMGYTLRVVDRISSEMKIPVKEIVSAYRTPTYNARCRGAKSNSWHQANLAVDVSFDTSARNVTKATRSLRDRGLFKGGVGSYSSFTHIDTRGENVNW